MEKLTVNKLKNEILNKEIDFCGLDNFMMENGYYSVFDDGSAYEIKQDKNVVYTAKDTNEYEVQIFFKIVYDSEEDEAEDDFTMLVKGIEEF